MIRFIVINAIWLAMAFAAVFTIRFYFPNWESLGDVVSTILYFTLSGLLAAAVTDVVDRWFFAKRKD